MARSCWRPSPSKRNPAPTQRASNKGDNENCCPAKITHSKGFPSSTAKAVPWSLELGADVDRPFADKSG